MRALPLLLALVSVPILGLSQSAPLTGSTKNGPMPTAGTVAQFAVTCPKCYTEETLTPVKLKVTKVERGLGGYVHYVSMSFVCPKCKSLFVTHGTKWVADPREVARPPKVEIPPPLPARTNSVTNP